jgi:hypothetical protein
MISRRMRSGIDVLRISIQASHPLAVRVLYPLRVRTSENNSRRSGLSSTIRIVIIHISKYLYQEFVGPCKCRSFLRILYALLAYTVCSFEYSGIPEREK